MMRGALRASGLRSYWLRQYACLGDPRARTAAETHVTETLSTLPLPYRAGYALALRLLPAAFFLATGRGLRSASAAEGRRGMQRLAALPGFADVVRSGTALALLGALDGRPAQQPPAPAGASR
ncbi:hypothetical protein FGW37_02540 [Streptomyces rectiverticillatus]|uniref:hypothetical protein n=1 Tax=Streptomyces rectiverticillatus TaxID=173860 RepID=UPI0015C375CB|nr:hypothetical protein [Streptomyces rectiverticillatus]QLE70633.1 hypothetical protein FGW37_02540 [Streptomyces rectiverticillatus]